MKHNTACAEMKPQRNVLCQQQAFSSITKGYKTPITAHGVHGGA